MLKLPYCITFSLKSCFISVLLSWSKWLRGGPEAVEAPGLIHVNKNVQYCSLKMAPTCYNKLFTNGKILILT